MHKNPLNLFLTRKAIPIPYLKIFCKSASLSNASRQTSIFCDSLTCVSALLALQAKQSKQGTQVGKPQRSFSQLLVKHNQSRSRLVVANNQNRLYKKKDLKTVRPLLNCSRRLITKICQSEKVPVYPDKSNQNVHYSRNKIRKQILPSIKMFCNPQAENAIFRFAELVIREQYIVSSLLHTTWPIRTNCIYADWVKYNHTTKIKR